MKVFSIGGSIVAENLDRIGELAEAVDRDEKTVVVTGAGPLNRYQKKSGGNQGEKDLIGIKATKLHAQTLVTEMPESNSEIPESPAEIQEMVSRHSNVVTGGLVPGYSTDAVAATAAEILGSELVIPSTVDGVYTADPESPEAERLEEVTPKRLKQIVKGNTEAGNHALIDQTALNLIQRSRIPTKFVEGSLDNIRDPASATGTRIVFKDGE